MRVCGHSKPRSPSFPSCVPITTHPAIRAWDTSPKGGTCLAPSLLPLLQSGTDVTHTGTLHRVAEAAQEEEFAPLH